MFSLLRNTIHKARPPPFTLKAHPHHVKHFNPINNTPAKPWRAPPQRHFSSTPAMYAFKSKIPSPGEPNLSPLTDFLLDDALDHPKNVALINADTGETLNYEQFKEKTQDLAIQYYIRGWEKGQCVAIILPNKTVYPLTYLAAAKVGIRSTLVNISLKSRLWVNQLRPMKIDYIITTQEILHYVRDACQSLRSVKEILVLNRVEDERDKKEYRLSIEMKYDLLLGKPPGWGALPDWVIQEDEVLTLPFTDQCKKGVELTQRNFTKNLLQLKAVETDISPKDVVAVWRPFYDVFSLVHSGTLPYFIGCKVVISESLSFEKFLDAVQKHKITYANLPASFVEKLGEGKVKQDISSLKTILCSEHLDADVYDKLKEHYPTIKLKQGYGAKDLSPPLMLSPADKVKPGSVGILLPDTEAKIIDPVSKKELGVNEEGELWVKGHQLYSKWWVPPPEAPRPIDLKDGKGRGKDPNILKPKPTEPPAGPPAKPEEFDEEGFYKTGDFAKVDHDGYWFIKKKQQ